MRPMEINKLLTDTEVQPEARAVLVVLENPAAPAVWGVLAVLEDPAVRAALAVAPTVSAVINPQRVVAAVAPSAEEAGRLPTRPAVAAAVAWEVVEVVVVAVTVAEEDAGAKRDERTRNIET